MLETIRAEQRWKSESCYHQNIGVTVLGETDNLADLPSRGLTLREVSTS